LHAGECEVRGDDVGGIGVHIGARVSALAGPNDVLVSSTLRDLVIGSGLAFEERGAYEGSRRGLSRHQTLRHAVAWSYDHLGDTKKALLERCSVSAGGFDIQSACAIMGSDDDFAALDLLDALVRKSLLVADRSAGRTRFSMYRHSRRYAIPRWWCRWLSVA
jgi:predicted ATPase